MKDQVGAYRILKILGDGALGRAHLSQEWPSKEHFVLKEIRPQLASDPNAEARA